MVILVCSRCFKTWILRKHFSFNTIVNSIFKYAFIRFNKKCILGLDEPSHPLIALSNKFAIITLKSNSETSPNSVSICVLSSMLSMALNSASILVMRIYISRLLSSVSVPLSPLPMCNFIAFSTSMFCCAVLRMASCRTPSSIVGDSWQYFLPKSSFGLAFFSLETFRNNFLNSDTDNYQKLVVNMGICIAYSGSPSYIMSSFGKSGFRKERGRLCPYKIILLTPISHRTVHQITNINCTRYTHIMKV